MFALPTLVLRRLALPLLAVASLVGAGCGGGHHHHHDDYVYGGTLEVVNDLASFETIETLEISQPFGPIEAYDVFLLPGETFAIDLFPDFYDLDVYWSDGFAEGVTVAIEDRLVTTVVFTN